MHLERDDRPTTMWNIVQTNQGFNSKNKNLLKKLKESMDKVGRNDIYKTKTQRPLKNW
jgi:hypothetical protein